MRGISYLFIWGRKAHFSSPSLGKAFFLVGICSVFLIWPAISFLRAEDYSSSSFILRDPLITIEGGRSASGSFEYFSSSGQDVGGENTSTSFIDRSGFLYFPFATSPTLSATTGNSQVSLNWTSSIGALANITTYQVGTSIVSGGTFTFENVGNVLTFTKTGLTNGTVYYFKVRAFADTLQLAESGQANATPTNPNSSGGGGGGGSGGGGGGSGGGGGGGVAATQITFSGRAYPLSKVTVLKDGQIAITTIAGPDANFTVSLSGLSAGDYTFSVYGEDSSARRSNVFTFPVAITQGATTNIGGIFITPTIAIDKSEVKKGDNLVIFGQSAPNAKITISVQSENEAFVETPSDKNGIYLYSFDTSPLEMGTHSTKSKAALASEISSFGTVVNFIVGDKNVPFTASGKCSVRADVNKDCKVNLVDFSIEAYWYKRPNPPKNVDLNGDKKVDLIDFSIMAYYWTG